MRTVFLVGLFCLLLPAGPVVVAARADVCTVPSQYFGVAEAISVSSCTEVVLAAGTFSEDLEVDRDLTLRGASSAATHLKGRVVVRGIGVELRLTDLEIDNNGCFDAPLVVDSGAWVRPDEVSVIDSETGVGCPVFADGFETGGTARWSTTVD